MNCPACGTPLVALEYDELEVDHCLGCGGLWLDAGELEFLYGDAAAAATFLAEDDGSRPVRSARRCPRCGRRMEERRTAGDEAGTVERCGRGHGLWLDRDERAALLRGLSARDGNPLARDLRRLLVEDATGTERD